MNLILLGIIEENLVIAVICGATGK